MFIKEKVSVSVKTRLALISTQNFSMIIIINTVEFAISTKI